MLGKQFLTFLLSISNIKLKHRHRQLIFWKVFWKGLLVLGGFICTWNVALDEESCKKASVSPEYNFDIWFIEPVQKLCNSSLNNYERIWQILSELCPRRHWSRRHYSTTCPNATSTTWGEKLHDLWNYWSVRMIFIFLFKDRWNTLFLQIIYIHAKLKILIWLEIDLRFFRIW